MVATTRDSVDYAALVTNQHFGLPATKRGGRVYPIPFEHVVVSGETGGASAGVQDKVNLAPLPLGAMAIGLELSSEALWASAGVNGTFQLGDAVDDDRYVIATESFSTNGPTASDKVYAGLALTGQNFVFLSTTPTLILTWKTANPVVGKKIRGCLLVILPE
jgi:hypothetical protein